MIKAFTFHYPKISNVYANKSTLYIPSQIIQYMNSSRLLYRPILITARIKGRKAMANYRKALYIFPNLPTIWTMSICITIDKQILGEKLLSILGNMGG
jgi:hypothetical protein